MFGNELKKIEKIAKKIESYDEAYSKLSDEELKNKTNIFKERLSKGESLDSILPEAFATVREASWRTLHMKHFPVQLIGGITLHKGMIAEMRTGEGKANPVVTPVPTPDGWKVMRDIKVGDMLFDRKGNPTKVLGVYPQGVIDTYEITLKDGRTVKCGEEHLWSVYDRYVQENLKVLTTKELYEKGALRKRGYNFFLPTSEAVEYDKQDFRIDPYVMGCFLGDGIKNVNGAFVISSSDEELVAEIAKIIGAKDYKKKKQGYEWKFYRNNYIEGANNETIKIKDLDDKYVTLLSELYCHEKYIPEEYKMSSIEQRWALIQGLMDTDGNIYEKDDAHRYSMMFSTTSEKLRDDIMEILYSLGCSCTWKYGKRAGNKTAKHDQFNVRINVPNEIKHKFFRLSRKKNIAEKAKEYKKRKDYSRIAIVDIKKLEEKTEQVCFEVDNDEHLFLVDKYVVTHNTLVATAPAYLNALTGKGVHVVTVNDYLAKRDMEQMRKVYNFLGLSVGCILQDMNPDEKKKAYLADITYGTNNEFGFDYLRDNMAKSKDKVNQRELNYAIIDEIDSILIDEARTPLIISSQGTDNMALFKDVDIFVKSLERGPDIEEKTKFEMLSEELEGVEEEVVGDFLVDEKHHTVILTKHGVKKAEEWFKVDNLSASENLGLSGYITQSLKANYIMKRDKDYLVKDDKIAIIDDFTGRLMENRRYSDGLHQAIEAKEGVKINKESKTQATTTLQNYFRMYNKISGMTGTAKTEETEFNDIYKLKVITIPTNRPIQRIDENDKIYLTMDKKYEAIIEKVREIHAKGQPVLIGTESVDKSEKLSKLLKKAGIPHNVLNAKQHAAEAMIIAQAGRLNAVTIATNMAGRGTDILLGGNPEFVTKKEMFEEGYDPDVIEIACGFMKITIPELIEARKVYQEKLAKNKIVTDKEKEEVIKAGGLYIIGTDRHESRRIDNQLRGRSGRQGDPGNSCFYLSLEDDLIRLFGGEQLKSVVAMTEKDSDVYLDNKILSKLVESSQKKIELAHYDSRKATLEYDDVNNIQRNEIYFLRREILYSDDNYDLIIKIIKDASKLIIDKYSDGNKKISIEQLENISLFINSIYESDEEIVLTSLNKKDLYNELNDRLNEIYQRKIKFIKDELLENPEKLNKMALLNIIDKYWISYISAMINLKDYVSVAGYGSLKPIQLYKLQALEMFNDLLDNIKIDVVKALINFKEKKPEEQIQNVVINLDNKDKEENKILNENIAKPTASTVRKPYVARNPALERRNKQILDNKTNSDKTKDIIKVSE